MPLTGYIDDGYYAWFENYTNEEMGPRRRYSAISSADTI
jgi:hypothetical protein